MIKRDFVVKKRPIEFYGRPTASRGGILGRPKIFVEVGKTGFRKGSACTVNIPVGPTVVVPIITDPSCRWKGVG